MAGSEKYATEPETIKYLVPLLAYNTLNKKKIIRYETLMKPLNKDGTPKGKFRELTTAQIKHCTEEADRLLSAIQYKEAAAEREERKRIDEAKEKRERELQAAAQEIPPELQEAINILKNGNPLKFLQQAFEANHIGHLEIFRSVVYAFCAQSSRTSRGIQPEATGQKGSGKTHSITSTIFLFPEEYVYNTSLSPKVLFYSPPKQGSMIYCDEQLDPALVNILKRVMSNFQQDTEHTAVIDKEPRKMIIPKRQVIMGSSVCGIGDDQFGDRVVQVGIINSDTDDDEYEMFEKQRRKEGRPEFLITKQLEICRAMMRHIREREFVVKMPDIKFAFKNDRRLINIFYDMVEASAILHYMQRASIVDEGTGTITITPNKDDVLAAQDFEMFRMAIKETDGRLTKSQTALHQVIQESLTADSMITEADIVKLYGKSQQAVRKLLYGDGGNPSKICGGLVERTSWYICTQDPDRKQQNTILCKKTTAGIKNSFAVIVEPEPSKTSKADEPEPQHNPQLEPHLSGGA